MKTLKVLFDNNLKWVEKHTKEDIYFFKNMSKEQKPRYLWIGCSDSRIPANEVVGLEPGELFVHRNVANLFVPDDLNCLAVLQYAVDVLKIEHVIVCGHYGCGGIAAALEGRSIGIMDGWLQNIQNLCAEKKEELDLIEDKDLKYKRLVELNVLKQVQNIAESSIVQEAWKRKQPLCIHGWIYDLCTGHLSDMNCCLEGY